MRPRFVGTLLLACAACGGGGGSDPDAAVEIDSGPPPDAEGPHVCLTVADFGTPTLSEQGLKDFEVIVWHGIYAPKGTPKPILDKVNVALRTALKDPEVMKRMADLGAEIAPDSKLTPEGLQSWLKSEIDRWGPVIRAGGTFAD